MLNKGILERSTFFRIRVVNSWNKLPEEVISVKSFNSFKNRLDKHNSRRRGAQEALPNILPPLAKVK